MAKVVRFLPVDPSPESRLLTNSLAHAADWFLAFHTAGTELGSLAWQGLSPGPREVLISAAPED
ncbi:hypothetical protein ACTMTB_16555 [Micromonospora sp. L32]